MQLLHSHPWLILCVSLLVVIFLGNIFQRKNAILRSYPIVGYLRYIAEFLGVFLRQFWFAQDREELPFNRAERMWVYHAAKNTDQTVGFGSTRDLRPVGTIYFVDAPFPVLATKIIPSPAITIGPQCPHPYTTQTFINISAMSYGSISKNAILALSEGAKRAGCWLNTGEGGVSPYHLAGGCDVVAQIGTAKFGFRDKEGNLSIDELKQHAANPQIKLFEIKLSQGAKPGKGGILPGAKVTPEIAAIRDVEPYQDAISPNRFPEINSSSELLDFIHRVRDATGKPTGFKVVLGNCEWLHDLCREILKRGIEHAPDFITLDGAEGGTGATIPSLVDYMGLPIAESLPVLVDTLVEYGLRERIKVIASGKLVTPGMIAWAFAVGADFVNSARGFMLALGCIQSLNCHKNNCPTGIATHNPWLMRALDPTNKAVRVYQYVTNLEREVSIICHSCGVENFHQLKRHHIRIVSEHGTSVSMADVYPDKSLKYAQ